MTETIYEADNTLATTNRTRFVSIKGKKKLAAKIFITRHLPRYQNEISDKKVKEILEKEIKIGQILYRNGISVPKYIGLIKIKLNLIELYGFDTYDEFYAIAIENLGKLPLIKYKFFKEEEPYKTIFEEEWEKIKKLNIFKPEIPNDYQGLYDKKKNKIYLIDFEHWNYM